VLMTSEKPARRRRKSCSDGVLTVEGRGADGNVALDQLFRDGTRPQRWRVAPAGVASPL
jgi:hypothetical protein